MSQDVLSRIPSQIFWYQYTSLTLPRKGLVRLGMAGPLYSLARVADSVCIGATHGLRVAKLASKRIGDRSNGVRACADTGGRPFLFAFLVLAHVGASELF